MGTVQTDRGVSAVGWGVASPWEGRSPPQFHFCWLLDGEGAAEPAQTESFGNVALGKGSPHSPPSRERTLAINDSLVAAGRVGGDPGWGGPGSPADAGQGGPGPSGRRALPGVPFCALHAGPPRHGRAEQLGHPHPHPRAPAARGGVSAAAAGPGRAVPPRPLLAALGTSPRSLRRGWGDRTRAFPNPGRGSAWLREASRTHVRPART